MPPRKHEHSDEAATLDQVIVLIANWEFVDAGEDDVEVSICASKGSDEYSAVFYRDPELLAQYRPQPCHSWRICLSIAIMGI